MSISNLLKLSILTLAVALSQAATAFEWHKGESITIKSEEILNDDIYATASRVIVDGTVNGDVVAFGQTVTINGTVNGNLIAAAQSVVIRGTVTGSVKIAGAVLHLGEKAKVGGDLVGAGASLEVAKGGQVGRDIVFAGASTLLAGTTIRNLWVAAQGLEIRGTVGGSVHAKVGEAEQEDYSQNKAMFMQSAEVDAPIVKPGLTIDPAAKIAGTLEYTQSKDLSFPANVVIGAITRNHSDWTPTHPNKIADWGMEFIRALITSLLLGLLLLLFAPRLLNGIADRLRGATVQSFLWGFVAFIAVITSIVVVGFATLAIAAIFGLLTLSKLATAVVFLGLLSDFTIILGFVFTVIFFAKIIVGVTVGKWVLQTLHSPFAESRFGPLLVGVPILLILAALFTFPMLPGVIGMLFKSAIVLCSFGAIWLYARKTNG